MDEIKRVGILAAVSILGLFSLASSVEALTIVNRDAQAHVLRIIEGGEEREVSLEPSQQADDLCSTVCSVTIDDSSASHLVAADAALSILDGVLVPTDELTEEPMRF
jgi:hypothetical protein